jgi:hypothetical protein
MFFLAIVAWQQLYNIFFCQYITMVIKMQATESGGRIYGISAWCSGGTSFESQLSKDYSRFLYGFHHPTELNAGSVSFGR